MLTDAEIFFRSAIISRSDIHFLDTKINYNIEKAKRFFGAFHIDLIWYCFGLKQISTLTNIFFSVLTLKSVCSFLKYADHFILPYLMKTPCILVIFYALSCFSCDRWIQ